MGHAAAAEAERVTPEGVAEAIAAAMEVRDDIARAEVHGTTIEAVTQGGTQFRVLILWPHAAQQETGG